MAKTANISLRIEPSIKAQLDELYSSFGISVTDAINIFLHASLMEGGFPFQPKQPNYNKETMEAIQETKDILAGKTKTKSYATVEEMKKDLGLE
ncbi:type II toxin-antitoxin system RelB/DinJ family antitoxin [Veillonella caviae]|uniref:type II toxin-antitoxin system RelB/DinJ family antitoxin n=1 Tax=Veillonella caviae TaxID=248316 RepID=UPI0023570724|nr:type II toxin-antitoxin system RelB/DinJ family antitoxin [Veillonella caviae]MDY5481094.1 type II toxin-antitoxin system RelB/DinJ family antitoxin [Veillonella caviae]